MLSLILYKIIYVIKKSKKKEELMGQIILKNRQHTPSRYHSLNIIPNSQTTINMSQIIMAPTSVYKVNTLKKFFKSLPDSYYKTKAINSLAVSCNYRVGEVGWKQCCDCGFDYVQEMFLVQTETNLTLGEHLNLQNLNDDCEIGLSIDGSNYITKLLSNELKNPESQHFINSPFRLGATGYLHYLNEEENFKL